MANRLREIILVLGLTAALGSLAAGELFMHRFEQHKRTAESEAQNRADAQVRFLAGAMEAALESARARAIDALDEAHPTPTAPLVFWAEWEWKSGMLYMPVRKTIGPDAGLEWASAEFESKIMAELAKQIHLSRVRRTGFDVLRLRPDHASAGAREWLALATLGHGKVPRLATAVIRPSSTFAVLTKLAASKARASLVTADGKVLAHALEGYVGSTISHPEARGLAQAQDWVQVAVASVAIPSGAAGLRVRLEEPVARIPEPPLPIRLVSVSIASFLAAFSFLLFWLGRKKDVVQAVEQQEIDSVVREIESPVEKLEVVAVSGMPEIESAIERELRRGREAADEVDAADRAMGEFESAVERMRDPREAAKRLTEVAARVCQSPVLYFSYDDQTSVANLQFDAGYLPGEAPKHLSFRIEARDQEQISAAAAQGRMPSLSQYEPLCEVLLARLGIAHFEAWVITGYGPLGRLSGRLRLLGVIVISQPGFESLTRKDSLARMIQRAGRVYENSFLTPS